MNDLGFKRIEILGKVQRSHRPRRPAELERECRKIEVLRNLLTSKITTVYLSVQIMWSIWDS